ncbi:disintegrin and metalloproteinase domain-containing protein 12-like [Anopheles ziemanni]|uniref:disintegrin and metalloproteinase domain-containing protein 12-like n=1 Tax=Anopheles coustani TaxID=139045 RepID=UPI00265A1A63|nr:disintegrin and metalloproteinase domain-containing protein 12-like [Anopheles coustani]XP_058169471.1 disintegrin and metalloproteinase domain-containing protein 12-like [Anopheles ziemanni]
MKLMESGTTPGGIQRLQAFNLLVLVTVLVACYPVIVSAVIHKRAFDLQRMATGNDHRSSFGWLDENFDLHGRIFPTFHCPRTKRALASSLLADEGVERRSEEDNRGRLMNRAGRHREQLSIQYGLRGESMTLDLTLNENIIPEAGYSFVSQTPTGEDVVEQLTRNDLELCHYEGTVRELPGSRVAVSTCNGTIDGVIYALNETYLIEYHNQTHLLYRRRFRREAMEMADEKDGTLQELDGGDRPLKAAFSTGYRENADSLFVELALVVDRTLFLKFGSEMQRVHRHCLSVVNVLNELYRPLNIYILLVGVKVWNTRDEIVISTDSRQTLTSFLAYRKEHLLRQMPNDNAHLLTAVRFPDGVIGKAELGSMCTAAGSGGIAVVENFVVTPLATTLAHEIGHNLNLDHDSEECEAGGRQCPGPGPCIMEAKLRDSGDVPSRWSSCSVGDLRESLARGVGTCLRNKPSGLLVRAVCGNGLLEPGEQCDCGHRDRCDNACCDAKTCQLKANATCATGACCDLNTCQPRDPGSMCRAARGECDLPEFCDGQSELCPRDVFVRDTSPCAGGDAFCYRGQCNTRDRQCRLLWGSSAQSGPNVCYDMNVNGTMYGNCGNNLVAGNDAYDRCAAHDVQCGLLHCTHRSEKLEYGVEAYAKRTATKFQHYGPRGTVRSTVCNAVIVDLGPAVVNPGLVPDGTKCGTGRMCFRQQCVAVSRLQEERDIGDECPGDCAGNGVCNSEGNCHCHPGFAPPFCDRPGDGGSIDSGPVGRTGGRDSYDLLLKVFLPAMIIGGLLLVFSLWLVITRRSLLMAQLRLVLKRFRERKYGHIVQPASAAPAAPKPTIQRPTIPPPPPIPPTQPLKPAQSFINVNISKSGKVTIENKLLSDSPFLHQQSVVDTHEAFRLRRLQERSYSVESVEHPLVQAETHTPREDRSPVVTPTTPATPSFGSVVQQLKQADRMQTYHQNRSKSDEQKPTAGRMLPKLPRQHTVGDFDSIERLPDVGEEVNEKQNGGAKPTRPSPKPIAIPRPLPRVMPHQGSLQPRLLPATPTPPGKVSKVSNTTSKTTAAGGSNVAALKAKLNLAEIGAKR